MDARVHPQQQARNYFVFRLNWYPVTDIMPLHVWINPGDSAFIVGNV